MSSWIQFVEFLNRAGLLPVFILLFAIPGGILLTLIGAKRYLFPGVGSLIRSSFDLWMKEQSERTRTEVKLEERLSDLTDQLKQIVANNWDNRRYFDSIIDTVKGEHSDIMGKLSLIYDAIPKRRSDQP